MTSIVQLMQVLQTAAPASPDIDAGGESVPAAGLAELFGKLLEEAQGKLMTGQLAEVSEAGPAESLQLEDDSGEAVKEVPPASESAAAIPVATVLPDTGQVSGLGQANQAHGPPVVPGTSGEAPPNTGMTPSGQEPAGLSVAEVAKSNEQQQPHGQSVAAVAKATVPPEVAVRVRPSAVAGPEIIVAVSEDAAAPMVDAQKASSNPVHVLAVKGKDVQEGAMKQVAVSEKAPLRVAESGDEAAAEVPRPGLTLKSLLVESSVKGQPESGENAPSVNALLGGTSAESVKAEIFQAKMDSVSQPQVAPVSDVKVGQMETARVAEASLPRSDPLGRDVETVHVRNIGDFAVKSVKYMSGGGEDTVHVRLVPRSLGELQIAVRSSGASVEIVVTAASQMARDVLEVQLAGLRDSLAQDGIEVSKVSVQTFTTSDSGLGHSAGGHSAQSGHQTRFDEKLAQGIATVESELREPPGVSSAHEGSLDMLV